MIFLSIYLIKEFDPEYKFVIYFVYYILLISALTILNKILKNNLLGKIANIVAFPAGLLLVLGTIFLPFLKLMMNLIVYFSLAIIIPYFLISLLEHINLLESPTLISYLRWTFTVFTAVLFNFQIRNFVNYISRGNSDSSERILRNREISDYLLSENNIRFTIYSIYFIYLIYNNISTFQLETNDMAGNKAVLQSFVTFIAFERALSILNILKFKPSDLLAKIHESISKELKEFNNRKN